MTEHDTPSTARAEGFLPDEVLAHADKLYWTGDNPLNAGCAEDAYEYIAEWVLAQVREGLETLQLEDDDDAPVSEAEAAFDAAYEDVRRLALAVVDRLEGKQ